MVAMEIDAGVMVLDGRLPSGCLWELNRQFLGDWFGGFSQRWERRMVRFLDLLSFSSFCLFFLPLS